MDFICLSYNTKEKQSGNRITKIKCYEVGHIYIIRVINIVIVKLKVAA